MSMTVEKVDGGKTHSQQLQKQEQKEKKITIPINGSTDSDETLELTAEQYEKFKKIEKDEKVSQGFAWSVPLLAGIGIETAIICSSGNPKRNLISLGMTVAYCLATAFLTSCVTHSAYNKKKQDFVARINSDKT